MEKECIFPAAGPSPGGPYSPVVRAGSLLFVSGQGPLAPDGSGPVRSTIEEEARLTLDNLKAAIEGAGSDLKHVVKVTVFLSDMVNFARFNDVYKTYFPENAPARTCVQAARLPLDFQVEIEAIAVIPGRL